MNQVEIRRYDLGTLLNYIGEDHFFRQKTKKIYYNFYTSNGNNFSGFSSNSNSSESSGSVKRKSFLSETEVFSDERSIQEIRGALGKMSVSNKQNIIEILSKNQVSAEKYDILVNLLHQYATLCIEWNDLYLSIYDKVYYQTNAPFYIKLYELSQELIENPREYDDIEQKMFFRISNIELFAKLGSTYHSFRKDGLLSWCNNIVEKLFNFFKSANYNVDWLILLLHFITTNYKYSSQKEKIMFKKSWLESNWYKEINQLVEESKLPIKIRFKWMDFADLIQ
jgi:hypothetical protein